MHKEIEYDDWLYFVCMLALIFLVFMDIGHVQLQKNTLTEVHFPTTILQVLNAVFDKEDPLEYEACLTIDTTDNTSFVSKIIFPPSERIMTIMPSFLSDQVNTFGVCHSYDGSIHSHPLDFDISKNPSRDDMLLFNKIQLGCVQYSTQEKPRCYSYGKEIGVIIDAFNTRKK